MKAVEEAVVNLLIVEKDVESSGYQQVAVKIYCLMKPYLNILDEKEYFEYYFELLKV
jgi:hypothetical protein